MSVAVSAPGKVLFAGGFLVLDRKHTGLVFGLDARIHVSVERWPRQRQRQRRRPRQARARTSSTGPAVDEVTGSSVEVRNEVEEAKEEEEQESWVQVTSPQFRDARWGYRVSKVVRLSPGGGDENAEVGIEVAQIVDSGTKADASSSTPSFTSSANKFVETTLRYALTYLSHRQHRNQDRKADGPDPDADDTDDNLGVFDDLKITILADDDYYSQSAGSSQPQDLRSGFSDFGVTLAQAHKTGLGSSAALVTALVGALLAYHSSTTQKDLVSNDKPTTSSPSPTTPALDLKTIHNLSQAAHCAAQGKVGSGFDVAAAVYGSSLYRRFSPSILNSVGDATSPGFGERLHLCIDDLNSTTPPGKWDVEVKSHAVQVPDSLLLVMCDVDCGSETPGMVRKLLKWREEKADEADVLWAALQVGQEDLCRELVRLKEQEALLGDSGTTGTTAGDDARPHASANIDSDDQFRSLADTIATIRSLVREMSTKSDVPVEPPVITELLDFCTALPGVVGGVAPGAGGYDAVALLVRNDPDVVRALQQRLDGWKSDADAGDGATIGKVRLLGVKQEKEGVRLEKGDRYQGWT